MKTIPLNFLILGSVIFFAIISGCIEGSLVKTDTVLVKLDNSGTLRWVSVFDNPDYAKARSLAPAPVQGIQTSDQGFFLAGTYTNSTGTGYLRTMRIDASGNVLQEIKIPAVQDQVLFISPRDDGGYLLITRHGRLFIFSPSAEYETARDISHQIIQKTAGIPAGKEVPPVTLLSVARSGNGNLMVFLQNHADIYHPFRILTLSPDGTILNTTIPDQARVSQTTMVEPMADGGYIFGEPSYRSEPGGGSFVMIRRTDATGTEIWNSTLGICNYSSCINDLSGVHESEIHDYEIVFQSHESSNSTSASPVSTVHARLDNRGQVIQQEVVKNISGVPSWLFRQKGSSSAFPDLLSDNYLQELKSVQGMGNPSILSVSLLRTDDGGYVLIATRYEE